MNAKTIRKFALTLDNLFPIAVALVITAGWFLAGCSDGGYVVDPNYTGGAGGDANSSGDAGSTGNGYPDTGSGGNTCEHVPARWEMVSYNGCMTSPRMSGVIRDIDDGSPTDTHFKGHSFPNEGGPVQGQAFVLNEPSSKECGPAKLAMVSNSGTIDVKVFRTEAVDDEGNFNDGQDAEFSMLKLSVVENLWMQLHNGTAPSADTYYTDAFGSLMIDVLDCRQYLDNVAACAYGDDDCVEDCKSKFGCALVDILDAKGKVLPADIMSAWTVTPHASLNGSFCGTTLIVARSRP